MNLEYSTSVWENSGSFRCHQASRNHRYFALILMCLTAFGENPFSSQLSILTISHESVLLHVFPYFRIRNLRFFRSPCIRRYFASEVWTGFVGWGFHGTRKAEKQWSDVQHNPLSFDDDNLSLECVRDRRIVKNFRPRR